MYIYTYMCKSPKYTKLETETEIRELTSLLLRKGYRVHSCPRYGQGEDANLQQDARRRTSEGEIGGLD